MTPMRNVATMTEKKHLNSLKRGLETLRILNAKHRITGSDLARRLKVPRTTAHRILETLAHDGYVLHDVANRCFRLSDKIHQIAYGFNRDSLLAEAARPVLARLCQETLMPVGLTTPVGLKIVTQVSTDHDAPFALERVNEGTAFPLTQGASGHIYLAHCSRSVRARLLSAAAASDPTGDLPAVPSDEELDRIQQNGFAISPPRKGWVEGLIAVPIYFMGDYVAAIHLRFMRRVVTEATVIRLLLPKLLAASSAITAQLNAKVAAEPDLFHRINRPLLVGEHEKPPA